MLKGIPAILSPELFKIMLEMGHGDEIVISDGNFPAASCAQRLVRCDGHHVPELLEAMLKFFPVEEEEDFTATLMAVDTDSARELPPIWEEYRSILEQEIDNSVEFGYIERYEFYERAKNAYAVVATSEKALYGNIILKKGVVTE